MTLPKSKSVIFDVGRVLFQWDLRHLFAPRIHDAAQLDWFLANVVTPDWHFQHDAGRPAAEMVAERCAEFPGHADHIRAWATDFNASIPGMVDGMAEIVGALADAGVRLFIITNFGHDLWQRFRPTQPIFDRFSGIIVSGSEGLIKPDPAIYSLALDRFDLSAAETLFIDDMPANVTGAASVGMTGHVFRGAPTLRRWLRGQGLPA